MDPSLAIYHTQLCTSYGDEQQRSAATNDLPASSTLCFPGSNSSVNWPYITPLLGIAPPVPHLSSRIHHPLDSSIVNTDAYNDYISPTNTSSTAASFSTRLSTLVPSLTSPNVHYFHPYWNLFGTAAAAAAAAASVASIQPSFDQHIKALKIKSERISSPVLTTTCEQQSIAPSSLCDAFVKEELISSQQLVRPKCEPCDPPHAFSKSPSSSSFRLTTTTLSEEEAIPLARRLSCDVKSTLGTTEPGRYTSFHSVDHLLQQVPFTYFSEDHDENRNSLNCAAARKRSIACQTWLAVEEPCLKALTSTAPQSHEEVRAGVLEENCSMHRLRGLDDPPLLTRELVEPSEFSEPKVCELRKEDLLCSVTCENNQVTQSKNTNVMPNSSASTSSLSEETCAAGLRLIAHNSSDFVHSDWRLVHDPCTGLCYRIPRMMLQPVLSTTSVNTVESATQTREAKRVLCDTCLKKCRLRKKNARTSVPPPPLTQSTRGTTPLVDLCASLFVLSKLSEAKLDNNNDGLFSSQMSQRTHATAALCSGFLTDLSNYDEHQDAHVFELSVLERLIHFLESLQQEKERTMALEDDNCNNVVNLCLPFDTSQTREVHTDQQHFTHLVRFSDADRLLLEQVAQVKQRLIQMRRSNAKCHARFASLSKVGGVTADGGRAGRGLSQSRLTTKYSCNKNNVTMCQEFVKKCSSNFSPFGSELHELAFIASELNGGEPDASLKNKSRVASPNSLSSMKRASEFTEPLCIDTSLAWQCATVATDPEVTSASATPCNTECTSVATSVSFTSPLQNSQLTLDSDPKSRYFNSMPIVDFIPEVSGHRRRRRSSAVTASSNNHKDDGQEDCNLTEEVQTKRYCEPPPALEKEAPMLDPRPPTPDMRSCMLDREDLYEGQRILITVDGNWFGATLHLDCRRSGSGSDNCFFSVALDGGRQLNLSRDQVLNCAVAEMKPKNRSHVPFGSRVAAYWSEQLSNLYAGTVSQPPCELTQALRTDQVFVCFDDEDERIVDICKVRMLPEDTPVMPVNARSDIFLSLPRRPRLNNKTSSCLTNKHKLCPSSATLTSLAAAHKNMKAQPASAPEHRRRKTKVIVEASVAKGTPMRCFRWADRGHHKGRKVKHKTLLCNDQPISLGDAAQFISDETERPYLGRVEDLFEENNRMWVRASWYYQPNEMADAGRPYLHIPAAIFASTHYDTNEVQTILTRVIVLQPLEFKRLYADSNSQSPPQGVFFEAGVYDAVQGRVQTTFDIHQFDIQKDVMQSNPFFLESNIIETQSQ